MPGLHTLVGAQACWIFDLDGTLTVAQHDFAAIRSILGIPPGRLILEYLDSLPPVAAHPLRARLDALEATLCASACAAPGAHELLALLHAHGTRLGILTRNTRDNALATLRAAALAHYFAPVDVLGRDEAPPKPAPDGILHLLTAWRGHPDRALMVGDVHLDLAAGRAAGVRTVHVSAGASARWPTLTDHHFDSLTALHVLLAGTATASVNR